MSDEIPLFPLNTVLFPGGPLALRIFEPRYLDMVGRCLRHNHRFGVVAIKTGSEVGDAEPYEVGTVAQIVDWYRDADGLLGITAIGRGRFRIHRTTRQDDGLYLGEVSLLAQEPHVGLPGEYRQLGELLRRVLAPLGSRYQRVATAYDDASWVGYRLAEVLPLPVASKQALLQIEDALTRLDELRAHLKVTTEPHH